MQAFPVSGIRLDAHAKLPTMQEAHHMGYSLTAILR